MPSAQVEEEGKRVDVRSSAQEDGNKSANDENGAENVLLEGKQCQAHVGEDEVLCQEM